jgi:FAD/FMN-containing dehydrogenase
MADVLVLLHEALPGMEIATRADDNLQYDKLTDSWSRPHGQVHPPYAVLRPKTIKDICTAVKIIKPLQYPLTVRSGGHDFWARSTGPAPDALILDIRDIDHVKVDKSNIAEIGGGANHYKVITELEKYGRLAVTGGCPSVGYAGWACCGGYGLQSSLLGLGVDQIVGATIVNANGDELEADDNLLWGIRGAGTAFGVITSLKIKTYPLQLVAIYLSFMLEEIFC